MPLNRSHSPLQKFSSGLLAHITILWAGEYERLGTPAAISADRDRYITELVVFTRKDRVNRYLPFGNLTEAIKSKLLFIVLYNFYYSRTAYRMMLGLRLSFSLTYLNFDDRVDTALRKTSDSDTSRVFLIKICSSTALKNCEATKTFISSIAFSGVLFTFMVSLI